MATIYAGLSCFFANRQGNHNYLDNTKRPILSVCYTAPNGTKTYPGDLFVDTRIVEVKETKTHVTLKFAKDITSPPFKSKVTKYESAQPAVAAPALHPDQDSPF
jgi:hypothetical protein